MRSTELAGIGCPMSGMSIGMHLRSENKLSTTNQGCIAPEI